MRLIVTGARHRPGSFQLGDGRAYEAARLFGIDTETGGIEDLHSFDTPNEHYPAEHPNLQFTAGCVDGRTLWVPTDTEIFRFDYPSLAVLARISHPFFQNVHSVARFEDCLAVTSTGLDLVAFLAVEDGRPLELVNVQGKDVWYRHSPDVDYRLVHSTRPHEGHPNFVFRVDDRYWVTRCTFDDAVCLDDTSLRIDIGRGRDVSAHDGLVIGRRIFFTTVDGRIVIADCDSLRVTEDIDLGTLESRRTLRGWCRGLHIDGALAFVGFSRLRMTRDSRKVRWLRNLSRARLIRQASVVCYDLEAMRKVGEWRFPEDQLRAIYSVLPAPD